MRDKKICGVRIDPDLANRLEIIKARTGLPVAEQIRRGIRLWLESREWPTPKRLTTAARLLTKAKKGAAAETTGKS